MESEEITALRKEVETLRAQYADLRQAFDMEVDNTTQHITSIYTYIDAIHEYLMPVVHKVFPGFAEAKQQLDALFKSRGHRQRR